MENCPFNMHILWYCIRLFIFYLFTWAVPDWLSCVIVLQPILWFFAVGLFKTEPRKPVLCYDTELIELNGARSHKFCCILLH
jgi:hypothetical protein